MTDDYQYVVLQRLRKMQELLSIGVNLLALNAACLGMLVWHFVR